MESSPSWCKEDLLQSPLFAPLHHSLSSLNTAYFPTLEDCNTLLHGIKPPITVSSGALLQFVAHKSGPRPFEQQYEPRCYLKGEVQTRLGNWHDLFNALVWITFPKIKSIINKRHYDTLLQKIDTTSNSQRGSVRDVNTLLDESGVIVVYSDDKLAALLRNFKWKELFCQHRAQVIQQMGFYIVGHGLYEKARQPYIGMTGQAVLLKVNTEYFTWSMVRQTAHIDALLASHLASTMNCCSTRDLCPVPLLGVPGWSSDNVDTTYYDNITYFRPGRQGKTS